MLYTTIPLLTCMALVVLCVFLLSAWTFKITSFDPDLLPYEYFILIENEPDLVGIPDRTPSDDPLISAGRP